jgi:hypothetical protein
MTWIAIRSEKLHRIICEIAPELGLLRIVHRGERDIVDLAEYGIKVEMSDNERRAEAPRDAGT